VSGPNQYHVLLLHGYKVTVSIHHHRHHGHHHCQLCEQKKAHQGVFAFPLAARRLEVVAGMFIGGTERPSLLLLLMLQQFEAIFHYCRTI
jgi:hypothetical protein